MFISFILFLSIQDYHPWSSSINHLIHDHLIRSSFFQQLWIPQHHFLNYIRSISFGFAFFNYVSRFLTWSCYELRVWFFICRVIFGLLKELRPYMGCLYKLCEHVAELDVILSLAQVGKSSISVNLCLLIGKKWSFILFQRKEKIWTRATIL